MWQGWQETCLVNADTAEQHAHERRAFNEFFCRENITAVLQALTEQVAAKCDELSTQAAMTPDGVLTLDMSAAATEVVAAIVKEVCLSAVLSSLVGDTPACLHKVFSKCIQPQMSAGVTPLHCDTNALVKFRLPTYKQCKPGAQSVLAMRKQCQLSACCESPAPSDALIS